jgi:Domain of unknown function (DUF5060)
MIKMRFSSFTMGVLIMAALALDVNGSAAPLRVTFAQSVASLEAYDFVEVTVTVVNQDVRNPFTDVSLSGSFEKASSGDRRQVDGFCDSPDGTIYRIRFMPPAPGDYKYVLHTGKARFRHRTQACFTR